MFGRLTSAIRRLLGHSEPENGFEELAPQDAQTLRDIEFRSLDPAGPATGETVTLLCPVTRRELKHGDKIYQCQACSTSYSQAGWEFLCEVDHGRCCNCGMTKSVALLS